MGSGDERAEVGFGGGAGCARADVERRDARGEAGDEGVGGFGLPTATATLMAMQRSPAEPKAAPYEGVGGLVEVGVGHDDEVVLGSAEGLDALAGGGAGGGRRTRRWGWSRRS